MCRTTLVALLALFTVGHVASQAPPAFAPPFPENVDYYPGAAPLEEKRLARDKFQAEHAGLKALAKPKLEAALDEFGSRIREFRAGRGTLDFVIGCSERLLDAELGVAEDSARRLAAFERRWELLRNVERTDQTRFDAGRIPIQDLAQSTYARLDAEIQLLEERERQRKR